MKLKVLIPVLAIMLMACQLSTAPQVIATGTSNGQQEAPAVTETAVPGEATSEIQPTAENTATPEPTIDPTALAKCSTIGGGIIKVGEIVQGQINDVNCSDSWSFSAKKGDYLIIALNAESGLHGALSFYEGFTKVVGNEDPKLLDAFLTVEIPEDRDDYSISVERYKGEAGDSSGTYSLSISLGRADGTPIATVNIDTICRYGPSVNFPQLGGLVVGDSAVVVGKGQGGEYWIIKNPTTNEGNCWIYGGYATVTGNTDLLPTFQVPIYLDILMSKNPDPARSGECFFKINGIGVPDSMFNLDVYGTDGGNWKPFKAKGHIFVPSSAKDNQWKFTIFPFGADSMKIPFKQLLIHVLVGTDEVNKIFIDVPEPCQ